MTDEAWLSELYERDYALLYRVGRIFLGSDAAREGLIEDQIQETFVRAWQKRAAVKSHPNPDGWLVECFRKCLLNACRKQAREWKRAACSLDAHPAPQFADTASLSPDEYAKTREQIDLLRRLLGEEDAQLFLRYCVYGERAAAIARDYGISETAVRMRVSRLKKKLLAHRQLFACVALLCLYGMR